MPLDAMGKGVRFCLHPLDDAVWSAGGDGQPRRQVLDRLVVQAVDLHGRRVEYAGQASVRCDGNRVSELYDVGVAGVHRLLGKRALLDDAAVVIVVAGMEGALASVVGGLVDKPVIAVPTSIGYGASFGGIAALLGMLNSCASGVTVVNIDNGFGAAYAATLINRCGSEAK